MKAILRFRPGVGKLFTRRTRFEKTVEAAGRTLIGKQGEPLIFFGDHDPRANAISKKRGFHLVFLFQLCTFQAYFLKIIAIHAL